MSGVSTNVMALDVLKSLLISNKYIAKIEALRTSLGLEGLAVSEPVSPAHIGEVIQSVMKGNIIKGGHISKTSKSMANLFKRSAPDVGKMGYLRMRMLSIISVFVGTEKFNDLLEDAIFAAQERGLELTIDEFFSENAQMGLIIFDVLEENFPEMAAHMEVLRNLGIKGI